MFILNFAPCVFIMDLLIFFFFLVLSRYYSIQVLLYDSHLRLLLHVSQVTFLRAYLPWTATLHILSASTHIPRQNILLTFSISCMGLLSYNFCSSLRLGLFSPFLSDTVLCLVNFCISYYVGSCLLRK